MRQVIVSSTDSYGISFTLQCKQKSGMLMLLSLSRVHRSICLTWRGNTASCLFLRPLPGICTYDTQICAYCIIIPNWSQGKHDNGNHLKYSTEFPSLLKSNDLYLLHLSLHSTDPLTEDATWLLGGEAGKHVIGAAEMGEVRAAHSLTSTLAPHQNLSALRLGSWCVAGVTCSHLHHPSKSEFKPSSTSNVQLSHRITLITFRKEVNPFINPY